MSGKVSSLVLVIWLVVGTTMAAEPSGPSANPGISTEKESSSHPAHETLESKTRLVKLLLTRSPAVQRITASGNAEATKMLAEAQSLYVSAGKEAIAGHVAAAIKLLDDALQLIVVTSRLVPDDVQLNEREQARYAQLLEAVHSFQIMHKNIYADAKNKDRPPAIADEMKQIELLVGKAEALAVIGNYHDADALMANAYNSVVSALNKMLAEETIVYDLKFATPAAEFHYETARYHSYRELIPIALAQLNPVPETIQLTERYVKESHELYSTAQQQADSGDHQAALKTLHEAIGHLQRSLRIAGVVVPQGPEN